MRRHAVLAGLLILGPLPAIQRGWCATPPAPPAKPGPAKPEAVAKPVPASKPESGKPAAAALAYDIDTPAQFMDHLFGEACLPNYQVPDRVRAYALDKKLVPITAPRALALYVGAGEGAAWEVNDPLGRFVLSIRGPSQGCAVWARQAEPLAVETYFRARVDEQTKPGTEAFADRDTMIPSAVGEMRAVLYNITEPDAYASIEMIMLSLDKPGGMFQASYQISKQGKRVPPTGR